MNEGSHHEFDPYSEESLDKVEMFDFLTDSIAFEHFMYDFRLERIARYEFSHRKDNDEDLDPLVITPNLMLSHFPKGLENIFPEIEYTIEQLQVAQIQTAEDDSVRISFLANSIPHSATANNGVASYKTYNESLEPVTYSVEPEAVTGLIAAFLYARQYDPSGGSLNAISLIEPLIVTPRDSRIDLTERMIMTFGDHSGSASLKTQSIFDNPSGPAIVATLVNLEFPDKSAASNTLTLDELGNINDVPTSIETTLYQNIVNIEHGTPIFRNGKLVNRYAEQRVVEASPLAVSTSELIDPEADYERWAQMCTSFMNIIDEPMNIYAELEKN